MQHIPLADAPLEGTFAVILVYCNMTARPSVARQIKDERKAIKSMVKSDREKSFQFTHSCVPAGNSLQGLSILQAKPGNSPIS